ncbi:MAG: glucose-6-phosphate dehydrogenase [Solirubrobacteraceae bacterium]
MTATATAADTRAVSLARPEDHVLILFGATGDLAKRKLLPGLFHLAVAGMMPERYRIVGSGRPEGAPDADGFRSHVHAALSEFGRQELTEENWGPFADSLSFAAASAEQPDALVQAVARAEQDLGGEPRRMAYLAVPPAAFGPVVSMIGASGLSDRARLIVEKPFGHDLASARALNQTLHAVFDESQIFRIDHFLGKEAVQNILAFRFANGLFEPAWNRRHVDYVQIDVPEKLTIEGRAGFFEQTGTFRDMVVTHLLHVLGFIAMEPPARLDAPSLRDATRRVFDAIRPLSTHRTIFGQYDSYRSEPGVAPDSTVETFAALEVLIDNERWAGVPFQLRTGKALAQSRHTVTLGFKEPARHMFELAAGDAPATRPNEISFELSDPGVIWVDFLAKQPGARMDLGAASLTFRYGDSFDIANELEGYERLIHDTMLGDHTLFTSADGIERLWEVAAPLLEDPPKPQPYTPGSWGPDAIDELIAPHRWHLPYATADENRVG